MTQETQSTATDQKLYALGEYFAAPADTITKEDYDHHGLDVYTVNGDSYAIGTDEEADAAARDYITDTLWAFKAEFILDCCNLDRSGAESLGDMQEKAGENANAFILSLITQTCGLDYFCEEALRWDGRGHFLSPYDGEEIELLGGTAFAYKL